MAHGPPSPPALKQAPLPLPSCTPDALPSFSSIIHLVSRLLGPAIQRPSYSRLVIFSLLTPHWPAGVLLAVLSWVCTPLGPSHRWPPSLPRRWATLAHPPVCLAASHSFCRCHRHTPQRPVSFFFAAPVRQPLWTRLMLLASPPAPTGPLPTAAPARPTISILAAVRCHGPAHACPSGRTRALGWP